jgi:ribosomal protein L3
VKRYGFGGGRASHGSKFHRDIGGTGMSATPSRTFKGRKMAGRMGNEKVTVQNLRVIRVDEEMQVLLVTLNGVAIIGTIMIRPPMKRRMDNIFLLYSLTSTIFCGARFYKFSLVSKKETKNYSI